MSLKKIAITGFLWTFTQQFSVIGISFIVSIILARLLLPSDFGLIGMISIFIALGRVLVDSGLDQSLIRTVNPTQEDYSTVFFFNLGGSCLIYLLIFLFAPFIADFYQQRILTDIIRLYSIVFIINAFSSIQNTRLTKQMDFKTQMLVTLPSLILGGTVGIIMAYNDYGVWSLVWSAIIQSTALSIQLWIRSKWKPSFAFNFEKFKYHFHFGYKLTISSVVDIIFNNLYTIIIGKFFSPALVGFYTRANSFKQLPVDSVSSVLSKITYPLFSSIQDDDVRLKRVYKQIMQMVVFAIAPLLIFMAVLAEPTFRFLFTEKWLPAVPYFQILCFNGILYPIHAYNLNILKVKGRSDLFLKLEIIKKSLMVIFIVISFQYGIYGLLYGSVLFSILAFFINTHYSGQFISYNSWEQTKDLVPILFLSLCVGFVLYLFDEFLITFGFFDLSRIFIGGILGLLIYLVVSYFLKLNSLFELIKIVKRK